MKRRVISVTLVLMMCFLLCGSAFAAEETETTAIQPRGAVMITCGLTNLGGGQYRIWSRTETNLPEKLYASVRIVKIVNGNEVTVTNGNASASIKTGTAVTASKTLTLSSGTYKVYGSGSGNTSSGGDDKTFTI